MKKIFFLFAALFVIQFSFAQEDSATSKSKFSPSEMIMHHISDAHEIHFVGDFSIYLPIIIKSEKGWDSFSSSKIYKNPKTLVTASGDELEYFQHEDYVMYHEKIYLAEEGGLLVNEAGKVENKAVSIDLSITKTVVGMFLVVLLMLFLFNPVAKAYKRDGIAAPRGLQSFIEPLVLFVRDEIARPSIGEKADRFTPFLLSTFFFIWIANVIGLIPFLGGYNITGGISVTLVLAGIVFIITSVNGNKHYWKHILWPDGVPFLVKIIVVPIEFAGIFIKPIVLMIRLTANMTAGHILLLSFVILIFIFGESSAAAGYGVGVGSVLFMVFMNLLKLLVAFLQAYVFTLLAALYFGSAVEEAH